jgi:hypothetical protein
MDYDAELERAKSLLLEPDPIDLLEVGRDPRFVSKAGFEAALQGPMLPLEVMRLRCLQCREFSRTQVRIASSLPLQPGRI